MFDGSNDWQDTASLAHATCDMLLFTLNDLVPGANLAGDMCNCMMENILAVGKFQAIIILCYVIYRYII